jgi:hypothetical protein
MSYTDYLLPVSMIVNALFAWAWYRRKELISTVFELRRAWRDQQVSEEEYNNILAKLEAVFEKGEKK